jgi:hypothetical protein
VLADSDADRLREGFLTFFERVQYAPACAPQHLADVVAQLSLRASGSVMS